MDPVMSRFPAILGSVAALVVTLISYLVQASPILCVMRAMTAFVLFAAFGLVARFLLGDSLLEPKTQGQQVSMAEEGEIRPGTLLSELLGKEDREKRSNITGTED